MDTSRRPQSSIAGHTLRRRLASMVASLALAASSAFGATADVGTPNATKPTPKDAASGFVVVGPATATWPSTHGGTASIAAAGVSNLSTKNATVSINLWATPVADGIPVINQLINFSDMGGINLGAIKAGQTLTNIAHGGLTYTQPAKGCYYVSLALLGTDLKLVDIFPLSANGLPSPTGYNVFSFGGASCAQTSACTDNAGTACLNDGRFQVNGSFYNAVDGEALPQVLSFGAARAQSEESIFYYFTDPSNFEVGIKVLNACGVNGKWWVFTGGLTNEGWSFSVLDTQTGAFKIYQNPLNTTSLTTADTAAFDCP
jgi:hypothetical protein